MDTIVAEHFNGNLYQYVEVVINSGNGYVTALKVENVERITIWSSGLVYVVETNGNLHYFGKADIFFKKKGI